MEKFLELKLYYILFILLILINTLWPNISLDFGLNYGFCLSFLDYENESFNGKIRYGLGYETSLNIIINEFLYIDIILSGCYNIFQSNKLGGYIYPDEMELPFSLTIGYLYNYKIVENIKFKYKIGLGSSVNYRIVGSYYVPRYYIFALNPEMSTLFNFENICLSIGPIIKLKYYFFNNNINYAYFILFGICYEVF